MRKISKYIKIVSLTVLLISLCILISNDLGIFSCSEQLIDTSICGLVVALIISAVQIVIEFFVMVFDGTLRKIIKDNIKKLLIEWVAYFVILTVIFYLKNKEISVITSISHASVAFLIMLLGNAFWEKDKT